MALPASVTIVNYRRILERRSGNSRETFNRFLRKTESLAVGVESLLDQHTLLCWVEFTIAYFAWALAISQRKQVGFEELVFAGGYSPDLLRLFSMAGFWVASLCIFLIMRRNHPAGGGTAPMQQGR